MRIVYTLYVHVVVRGEIGGEFFFLGGGEGGGQ